MHSNTVTIAARSRCPRSGRTSGDRLIRRMTTSGMRKKYEGTGKPAIRSTSTGKEQYQGAFKRSDPLATTTPQTAVGPELTRNMFTQWMPL